MIPHICFWMKGACKQPHVSGNFLRRAINNLNAGGYRHAQWHWGYAELP